MKIWNLVLVCMATFLAGLSLSIMTPFYPTEALTKVEDFRSTREAEGLKNQVKFSTKGVSRGVIYTSFLKNIYGCDSISGLDIRVSEFEKVCILYILHIHKLSSLKFLHHF